MNKEPLSRGDLGRISLLLGGVTLRNFGEAVGPNEWALSLVSRGQDVVQADLGGVAFDEAAIPGKFHKCKPQTLFLRAGNLGARCACGGISINGGPTYLNKNERRKK